MTSLVFSVIVFYNHGEKHYIKLLYSTITLCHHPLHTDYSKMMAQDVFLDACYVVFFICYHVIKRILHEFSFQ